MVKLGTFYGFPLLGPSVEDVIGYRGACKCFNRGSLSHTRRRFSHAVSRDI